MKRDMWVTLRKVSAGKAVILTTRKSVFVLTYRAQLIQFRE